MAERTAYDLGDIAVLNITFSVAGVPTDPTAVSLTVARPDGSLTEYDSGQISHDGTGVFHVDVVTDQAGDWAWRWVGTGAAADVETGNFVVLPNPTVQSGRDLCALLDVFRLVPGFDPEDADNSDIVGTCAHLISSESASIMRETGREIIAIPDSDPRTFDLTPSNCRRRSLPIGDAATVSKVELFDYDGTTSLGVVAPSLYVLLPRLRETWEPFTRIRFPYRPAGTPLLLAPGRSLVLTGTWGFPEIPLDLRQACAKRVVLRYVADNANAGTRLADALDDTFSIGALLASARDTVDGYSRPGFA